MSDAFNNPTPQFGTAEYTGTPGNDHCQFCDLPVFGTYYRINDAMACPACADKMRGEMARDTHAAFMRALLYGIGAAIVGLILYATFAIVTGIIIGYVSLAVGWMVGKAIMKGSNGVGGRRYQITAVVLTYAAVSMAAIPIWIHYAGKRREMQQQQAQARRARPPQTTQQQQQQLAAEQRQLESEFGQQPQKPGPKPSQPQATAPEPNGVEQPPQREPDAAAQPARPRMNRSEALVRLALLGLASPIVEVWEDPTSFGGWIGLIILFVGIRFAAKITAGRPQEVYGPFENSSQPSP